MTSRAPDLVARPEAAGDDRRVARLLSALAEAPDYGSAALFLLDEVSTLARGAPAVLLRYMPSQESLVLVDHALSRAFDNGAGAWAAAIYLLMPGVWLSSTIMSTDAVLLPAWS